MRRRLLLMVLAATTMVAISFAIPLAGLVRSVARDRAIDRAERDLAALAPLVAINADRANLDEAIAQAGARSSSELALWLPDGAVLGGAGVGRETLVGRSRTTGGAFSETVTGGVELYSPIVMPGGEALVAVAFVPERHLRQGVFRAWSLLAAVAGGLIVGGLVMADRVGRSMVDDATLLETTAAALAAGDREARAPPAGTPELDAAGRTLNLLADRIDELRAAERERIADLSHRLRTPLTAVRLAAEAASDPGLLGDIDRLEHAVTGLITEARRPLRPALGSGSADLLSVLEERLSYWAPAAEDAGRSWSLNIRAGTAVGGRPRVPIGADDLAAVVDALVTNTLRHTPEGTAFGVTVEPAGDRLTLSFDDAGPGFDDPVRAIERGAARGSGTGLGLDIVRSTIEAAGGAVVLGRGPSGGALVSMTLPTVSGDDRETGTLRPH